MTCAVRLAHEMRPSDGIELVMLAPLPYQQALSELDLVAAGTPRPQWAELWHGDIFAGLDVKVVYERLENVCPAEKHISIGPDGAPVAEIAYWRLVLATGAVPYLPPVPGLREHALTLWSVDDALELQKRVEKQFEIAATLTAPEECRRVLSVCVVGGGATGVEVIGTIASVMPKMLRRLGYDPSLTSLTLLEGRPEILYDLAPAQRAQAIERLEGMGVRVVVGEKLARAEKGIAVTETGRVIPASVLVWCGGAQADPDAVTWGLAAENSGRLLAEPSLKAADHDDIYVVGDVAAFRHPSDNHVLPMLAQFAIREAAHAADNVLREARGTAPTAFEPHMKGEFVSVGPHWGVGWMFGWRISGWPAIVMKRLTYVVYWLRVGSYRLAWRRTRQMLQMHRY
jgi:NADH dehydrogenase